MFGHFTTLFMKELNILLQNFSKKTQFNLGFLRIRDFVSYFSELYGKYIFGKTFKATMPRHFTKYNIS